MDEDLGKPCVHCGQTDTNHKVYICVCLSVSVGVCMPTEKERMRRLSEILGVLKDNGGKMKYGKLYGEMALKYGVTSRTFWDYLHTLKLTGKIDYSEIVLMGHEGEIEIELIE